MLAYVFTNVNINVKCYKVFILQVFTDCLLWFFNFVDDYSHIIKRCNIKKDVKNKIRFHKKYHSYVMSYPVL